MEELQPAELEAMVSEFVMKLDRLRVLYDQYFMGIIKREPSVQLKDLVRVLHVIDQQKIRNSRLRFRFRSSVQKFNTLRTQWNRILRQIDAGTYERDVARVRRKMARSGVAMPSMGKMRSPAAVERAVLDTMKAAASETPTPSAANLAVVPDRTASPTREVPVAKPADDPTPVPKRKPPATSKPAAAPPVPTISLADEVDQAFDSAFGDAFGESPAAAPTPPPAAAPAPRAAPPPSAPPARRAVSGRAASPTRAVNPAAASAPTKSGRVAESEMQSIYRRFVKAKRLCGEDTGSLKYEAVERTVNQQLPKLRAAHPGKTVEFQVVIRQGRAILKAVTDDK